MEPLMEFVFQMESAATENCGPPSDPDECRDRAHRARTQAPSMSEPPRPTEQSPEAAPWPDATPIRTAATEDLPDWTPEIPGECGQEIRAAHESRLPMH